MDCRDGRLVYANAGHTTGAIVGPHGEVRKLPATGPLLGAFPNATFQEAAETIAIGDLLFLYTDGLTEARRGGELYGSERLFSLLAQMPDSPAEKLVDEVLAQVAEFSEHRHRDDLAILAVRRASQPANRTD